MTDRVKNVAVFGHLPGNTEIPLAASFGYHKREFSTSTVTDWPQEGDVFLFHTIDNGEINFLSGIIEMNGGLETAAYLSLFGGNKDDDGRQDNPLEWWGNKLETDPVRTFRSETQNLLRSIPATSANLKRIEDAARKDLSWFVARGVATTLNVSATIPALNRVEIIIIINVTGEELEFKFSENWKGSI